MAEAKNRKEYEDHEYVKDTVVAEIAKKSVSSLRLDRHKKRGIPYVKFGGAVLYRVSDVYAHLERCKVTPGEDQAGATA